MTSTLTPTAGRSSKTDKSKHKRKPHDKKKKGGKYEKEYKPQAAEIEQLEQQHTDLLARLEKGTTMQPAPPSAAPAFGASSAPTEQRAATSVSLRSADSPTGDSVRRAGAPTRRYYRTRSSHRKCNRTD